VRLALGARGRVVAGGTVAIEPLDLDLHAVLTAIPVPPFQGYFTHHLGTLFTDGTVSAAGRMRLARPPGQRLRLEIAGGARVANLAARDGRAGKELGLLGALDVTGVTLSLRPFRLAVSDVALDDLAARLVLRPDGRLNVVPAPTPAEEAVRARPAPAPPPAPPRERPAAPAPNVAAPWLAVGEVRVRRARVQFIDRTIRPTFTGEIDQLDGRVSRVDSRPSTRADVEVTARIDRAAALGVTGAFNLFGPHLAAELRLGLSDLDLPPLSPYAAKYAGATVDKGKLALSTTCRLAGGALDTQNHVVIDQLELGADVASPDAVELDVRRAVKLMKDQRGRIELDLPVSGSLGDPHFALGQAIRHAIANVVGRVMKAPFALIAAAFGGGGGDQAVFRLDFAPGSAALDARAEGKLRSLGRALREHDDLSLEIEGGADPAHDLGAVQRELHARGAGKGEPALRADALLVLARRRASAVRGALARAAPGAEGRLFVVTPRAGASVGSRVQLRLRER
jgi:hypothetical protein